MSTTITLDNLDSFLETECIPNDMRDEISSAIMSGCETSIEYHWGHDNNNHRTHYVFFPTSKRGGVCQDGLTDWTDCYDLSDLEERWENYDERWVN